MEWDPRRNPERANPAILDKAPVLQDRRAGQDDITRAVVVRERHVEGDGLVRLVLADPAGGRCQRGRPVPTWTWWRWFPPQVFALRHARRPCGAQVVILREAAGRGGSRHFCDAVAAGDTIHLAGPKNLFRLDESAQHHILIAGGIGITPILAMADRLKALGKALCAALRGPFARAHGAAGACSATMATTCRCVGEARACAGCAAGRRGRRHRRSMRAAGG